MPESLFICFVVGIGIGERRVTAVASDIGCNTLEDAAVTLRSQKEICVGVGVNVNPSRRYRKPLCIKDKVGIITESSDGCNTAVTYADITLYRSFAVTRVDDSVFDNSLKGLFDADFAASIEAYTKCCSSYERGSDKISSLFSWNTGSSRSC